MVDRTTKKIHSAHLNWISLTVLYNNSVNSKNTDNKNLVGSGKRGILFPRKLRCSARQDWSTGRTNPREPEKHSTAWILGISNLIGCWLSEVLSLRPVGSMRKLADNANLNRYRRWNTQSPEFLIIPTDLGTSGLANSIPHYDKKLNTKSSCRQILVNWKNNDSIHKQIRHDPMKSNRNMS